MGRFSTKLGFAVLFAALIRVRDGLPSVIDPTVQLGSYELGSRGWEGLLQLVAEAAPLTFLAVYLVRPNSTRQQIAMTGLMGLAIPLFASVILLSVVGAATSVSHFYQPSLDPSVAMALWSQVAHSAMPGGILIAGMTIFGAARFGARALAQTFPIRTPGNPWWVVLPVAVLVSWSSNYRLYYFEGTYDFLVRCFSVASGIITADFWFGHPVRLPKRFDWVGIVALLAGLALPMLVPNRLWANALHFELWWHPWLLPSYAIALAVCLVGRIAGKLARATFSVSVSCG